ncbi:PqiC family protein [Rhodovulum sulfidophilum]|uniref:PqiC family protein n=1 Tax=Rhodovulum sulfidophilum TaxID=35806 RepID=UPI000951A04B|nr:ABC-type transport auxiliary lipoprotein family protein [Rhodovulum sulfidophilum]MBL3552303.1 membrane integrity-associated transporter subunit PqiC [Rhodovulum sulfidophilum]OLS49198.1 hypothetical protein BV379_13555 [Rhodovulum sulfidophilum]
MKHRLLPAALVPLALALTACSGSPERYTVPDTAVDGPRLPVAWRSVAIRDVSLPTYAASEEIYSRSASGALTSSSAVLWADDPSRAITRDLARLLARMTGAQVAAEPWPFFDRAQATLEVRVADMLAESDGTFRLTGQFFVAPDAGGRNRAVPFAISAPIAAPAGPAEIAAARGVALRELATRIARTGLR